ncbi:MAG: hypothetical protein COV30_00325 [Candidatus Yanofskybacteria bacterium CG10_big_fil_rev_8_21_14_0_10_37_15]|uniref:CAAX prenyl protease 2/Lysostaphin resistance protein A-like domain-containing protein n=1 Tax=Candidatus Yanofskybacteria bacterium CG10_big_fil_rev_8_21_14_0_10_37_15 TaxID=1975097 RepID=A0A2H0R7T1_9BACT|nr:MAG: hypothetical protein COV30_00325 [Candidatus Yanofskybacteria bacterium CG10_big_fil_rev_8_21_14_0_10_37_15]
MCGRKELIHGKFKNKNYSTFQKVLIFLFSFVTVPICEELIFRGPILLLIQHDQLALSLAGTLILGSFFGVLHKDRDYSWLDCLFIAFAGICLGLITIASVSLYPAIIAHSFHNGDAFLQTYNQNYRRIKNKYATLVQR